MLALSVDDSGKESSNGFWLVVSFLGLCAVAALVIPTVLPRHTHSSLNACINNLRQIDAAKIQFALENKKNNGDPVTEANIKPYLAGGALPKCPAGGKYVIGKVDEIPTCSIDGHVLP